MSTSLSRAMLGSASLLVWSVLLAGGQAQQVPVGSTDLDLLPIAIESAYDGLPCGKVFRIATHIVPPFINVDATKCPNQKVSRARCQSVG